MKYPSEPTEILALEEPMATYGLGLIEVCRKGITRKELLEFSRLIGESIQTLADIMPSSYSSLTKKTRYDLETSERILELASLYTFGRDVFGNLEKFSDWLHTESMALDGNIPFSLLDTSFGFRLVREELGRIDHGIF